MKHLRHPAFGAAAVWLAVYCVVWVTGQRFSTAYLDYSWQLVPYDTLRADPLGSVWYLHIQPPGWNLTLGILGRWSPLPTALSLQLLMMALGALLAATLASLLMRLCLPRRSALVVALVATLNPTVIKMAFDPQYELAVACLLAAMLWAVATKRLLLVTGLGTALVMTRSLYPWAFLVVVFVPIALAWRETIPWRRLVFAAAIPLLVVGGWIVKNAILFDRPTLSSWSGMNLERAVVPTFSEAELSRLAATGDISVLALVGPFQAYDAYEPFVEPCTPTHDHAAVDQPSRDKPVTSLFDGSDTYVANFNYECYLAIYDQAGEDASYLSWHYPGKWLNARLWSARASFGAGIVTGTSESAPLRWLDAVYEVGRVDVPFPEVSMDTWGARQAFEPIVKARVSMMIAALSLVVVIAGCRHAVRLMRRRVTDIAASLVMVTAATMVAWTFVVGLIGELGEQARFRTATDPIVVALGVMVALRWIDRQRRARTATSSSSS